MIKTIVTWNTQTATAASTALLNKISIMTYEHKTDGEAVVVNKNDLTTVTRTWTTISDAEEWINFVNDYDPVSAEIKIDE
jgi:hypothetical protein